MHFLHLMKRSARTLIENPRESALLVALCYLTSLLSSGEYLSPAPAPYTYAGLTVMGFLATFAIFAFGIALVEALLDDSTTDVLGYAASTFRATYLSLVGAHLLVIIALIAFVIVSTVAILVIPLIGILLVFPILIFLIAFGIVFAFIDVSVVIGGYTTTESLRASYEFVRSNLVLAISYCVTVVVLSLLAATPLFVTLFATGPLTDFETATLPVTMLAILSIPTALVTAYALCLRTTLYRTPTSRTDAPPTTLASGTTASLDASASEGDIITSEWQLGEYGSREGRDRSR